MKRRILKSGRKSVSEALMHLDGAWVRNPIGTFLRSDYAGLLKGRSSNVFSVTTL